MSGRLEGKRVLVTHADRYIGPPVVDLFRTVLQVEDVGATAGFFDLGGHSLLVFQLVERCSDAFGVDLPVRQVLKALTPRTLAALLDDHPDRVRP